MQYLKAVSPILMCSEGQAVMSTKQFQQQKKKQKRMIEKSLIAERYLSKNKKYYSYKTLRKDKEDLIEGDIQSIVKQLSQPGTLSNKILASLPNKINSNLLKGNSSSCRNARKDCHDLGVNSIHFFGRSRADIAEKKSLKKDVAHYLNKLKSPFRPKCSLYQEFMQLSQDTSDYLEYYLTTYAGEESGKASDLLKEQGKTIILLIFRKNYKFFETNPPDINNRIMLAFNLNPLNDFQFIKWEKFMKMRKLISCEFNRRDCYQFVFDYFFLSEDKTLKGSEFWAIFKSVMRKLSACMDGNGLELLVGRIMDEGAKMIPEDHLFKKEELRRIVMEEPLFIWDQFVRLVFC